MVNYPNRFNSHWTEPFDCLTPTKEDETNQQKTLLGLINKIIKHQKETDDQIDFVICPSLSFDQEEVKKVHGAYKYEERQLFNIFLLRNPKARMIFLSSEKLEATIVE